MGGTDKGLDMSKLVAEIPKRCKGVILLAEVGTEKFKNQIVGQELGITIKEKDTLKECVVEAMKIAKKGDIVLFSPAFASFGKWFKNEYDRGEQFVEIVKKLKD
jgi:UDP-N-acetylmuramoylalanine--D-glutamate ligase